MLIATFFFCVFADCIVMELMITVSIEKLRKMIIRNIEIYRVKMLFFKRIPLKCCISAELCALPISLYENTSNL